MASTRSKRSATSAGVLQEASTPAKVARVGGAEPASREKPKKKGESLRGGGLCLYMYCIV